MEDAMPVQAFLMLIVGVIVAAGVTIALASWFGILGGLPLVALLAALLVRKWV
jgi:hypothetical protein